MLIHFVTGIRVSAVDFPAPKTCSAFTALRLRFCCGQRAVAEVEVIVGLNERLAINGGESWGEFVTECPPISFQTRNVQTLKGLAVEVSPVADTGLLLHSVMLPKGGISSDFAFTSRVPVTFEAR